MKTVVTSVLVLLFASLSVGAQPGKRPKRDLTPFEGTWVLKKTSQKVFSAETWHITTDYLELRITKIRTQGSRSSTNHLNLFVDKRGEENALLGTAGGGWTETSKTSWEDGAIVRRYQRTQKQTAAEKMFSSDHLRLSNDGKRLTVLTLDCPEFMWPTNPSQERAMCFDYTRIFEKEL